MSISLKLMTAPRLVDADADGIYEKRVVLRGGGRGYDDTAEIDIGANVPEIVGLQSGLQSVEIARGQDRTFRTTPDRLTIRIDMSEITGEDLQALHRTYVNGRALAFHPWYDPSTWWMSTFGGQSRRGFLAEIGYNASDMLTPRNADDYVARRGNGYLSKLPDGEVAKMVPGMIGNAILLERESLNEFSTVTPGMVAGGNAVADDSGGGNNPLTNAHAVHLPDDAGVSKVAITPSQTIVSADHYILSCWARGEGSLLVNAYEAGPATHNRGTAVALDPNRFQRVYAAWQPGSVLLEPRLEASGAEVYAEVSGWQLENMTALGTANREQPTSFADIAGTPTGRADELLISDAMPVGGGRTLVFWVLRADPSARCQCFHASTNFFGYIIPGTSDQVSYDLMGTGLKSVVLPDPSGEWEQFVFMVRKGRTGTGLEEAVYHNGQLLHSFQAATGTGVLPDFDPLGIRIGTTNTGDYGMSFPLDRARIDARPWSDAEVAADYAVLREPGIQAFLAQTQGRFFKITRAPGAFLAGIFVDRMEGEIVLEQVGVCPMGLVS